MVSKEPKFYKYRKCVNVYMHCVYGMKMNVCVQENMLMRPKN